MADIVSVTQADRAVYQELRGLWGPKLQARIDAGDYDSMWDMQLLARHRLASTQPAPAFPREEWGTLVHAVASLRAAISLLEKGGKKAAPSDKMFAQMLKDYHAAATKAAALLQGKQP